MITIKLTPKELAAILHAINNMTDGNARDVSEMRKCGITNPQTLLRAEMKLIMAGKAKEGK